jgi:hypothetical protein
MAKICEVTTEIGKLGPWSRCIENYNNVLHPITFNQIYWDTMHKPMIPITAGHDKDQESFMVKYPGAPVDDYHPEW